MISIGDMAPNFSLPDTQGQLHQPGGAAATVVVFTCNHCPYALAWHDRIVDVARDYEARGVRVLAVNPNDERVQPRDSLDAMRQRVEQGEFGPVPYLHDESQEVAREFGAETTPDVFVLDSGLSLRYRGAPDRDHDDPSQGANFLRAALDAVLAGQDPDPAETPSVGCTVKWRE
jgi:peroxiredoxin